jgi:hypothetical protein
VPVPAPEPETPFKVPDVVGKAIDAWRLWRIRYLNDSYRLVSLWDTEPWPARQPIRAVCRKGRTHGTPAEDCECGIYALAKRSQFKFRDLAFYRPREDLLAVGRVALWGTLIEGTLGWRAEVAYPAELWVVSRSHSEVDAGVAAWGLKDTYGVVVHPASASSWI